MKTGILAAACLMVSVTPGYRESKEGGGGEQISRNAVQAIVYQSGDKINRIISETPEGGVVNLGEGYYLIDTPVVPKRGQKVIGSAKAGGTVLRLKDGVNQPVVIIENDNVTFGHVTIDGNRQGQTQERSVRPGDQDWYTCVNGVTVYRCRGVLLHDILSRNCRSAGFCAQFGVENMTVERMITEENEIDGFTVYETTNSRVSNLISQNNPAAGISMDCDNRGIVFENPQIIGNGTCLYLRASSDISFSGGKFHGNGGEVSQNLDYRHNPFSGRDHDGKSRNIVFDDVSFAQGKPLLVKDDSVVKIQETGAQ